VCTRTNGRKAYRHPLVGLLDLHQENFAPPGESGMELLVLSAPPGSPPKTGCACSPAWAGTAMPGGRMLPRRRRLGRQEM
jgi:hypothetical protein